MRLRRVMLYLSVGALLSLVSAWLCVWYRPDVEVALRQWSMFRSNDRLTSLLNHWDVDTSEAKMRTDWLQGDQQLVTLESKSVRLSLRELWLSRSLYFLPAENLAKCRSYPHYLGRQDHIPPLELVNLVYSESDHVYGFPFPCFLTRNYAHVTAYENPAFAANRLNEHAHSPSWFSRGMSIMKPPTHSWPFSYEAHLPLRPWLAGFIPSTLFWAGVAWLPVAGFGALRHQRRRRVGLCSKCASPRGVAFACSECGAPFTP